MFEEDVKSTPDQWFGPLAADPAYFHTMVFTTVDYFDLISGKKPQATPGSGAAASENRALASPHSVKALGLLRQKLASGRLEEIVSTVTLTVVLALAHNAHIKGENAAARHHMGGLKRLLGLMGGLRGFWAYPKLIIEVLR